MLPNLTKLAAIGLLLPVSTVDCEKGFSALSRVKTYLQNRLCNRTYNNLLIISIEGPDTENYPIKLVTYGLHGKIEEFKSKSDC